MSEVPLYHTSYRRALGPAQDLFGVNLDPAATRGARILVTSMYRGTLLIKDAPPREPPYGPRHRATDWF